MDNFIISGRRLMKSFAVAEESILNDLRDRELEETERIAIVVMLCDRLGFSIDELLEFMRERIISDGEAGLHSWSQVEKLLAQVGDLSQLIPR